MSPIPVKNEHKTALLLLPHRLLTDHMALESLHIERSKGGLAFASRELDGMELRKHYAALPRPARDVLMWFNKEGARFLEDDIKKKFVRQRAGMAWESYYKNAVTRRLHELLERLKPFASLTKWYHRLPGEKGHFKTAPCSFSAFKPQLQFEVIREAGRLQLRTLVLLNGTGYPLSTFSRHHFLLEDAHEYFLLSYKDYQTLEWLQETDPAQYGDQPAELARQVLAKLEADYPVNRNNLFDKTEIRAVPLNRVLLSEISQSFLVLTPQWLYEGFLVEGPWKETFETTRQGEPYVVQRDRETESAFIELLESLHPNFPRQLNGYYYLSFEAAQKKQWFLKVYHRLLELDIQLAGMDMLQHFRYSSEKIVTETRITEDTENLLTLEMRVAFGKEDLSLSELQKIVQAGQRAILLKDGSMGILDDQWLQQYGLPLRHGKVSKKELRVPRWLAFSEQAATEDMQVLRPVIRQNWWEKWQQWQSSATAVYPLPATIRATLRPYQQKGYEWLLLLAEAGAGACLADDMGLGKTLQTICFLVQRLTEKPGSRHLIICPSSLIYNWQQELQKFAPHLRSLVYHSATRSTADLQGEQYEVIITSYHIVRNEVELFAALAFNAVVLDESHNIKNPSAQITRAAGRLQGDFHIALSGTPVMNNTFDLYAQLDFLLPGLFGSREFFKREYADAIDRQQNREKIEALQKLTAPFVLRRTKEQVAGDLPPKTETILWCEMGAAQRQQYEAIREMIRSSVFLDIKNQGLNRSKLAVLQGMLRLRQICNSPLLLPEDQQESRDSVKTEMLMEELSNNLKGHKVLVFSQFTTMLDLLAKACTDEGIAFYHFDGQTPPAKRAEMVNRFQDPDDTTNVFLLSLKAGNAGLNLTAAGYVFLFDPWWNTAVQQQAIDRTHRIGQTKSVFAYKMICKDSIEEKIMELQLRKKQLAEELVSEEEGFVKALTEEDIAYLFS